MLQYLRFTAEHWNLYRILYILCLRSGLLCRKHHDQRLKNTLQQLAGAIGTSIITTIVAASQAKLPDDLAAATAQGTQHSFYLLAVLAVAVICCSLGVFALTGKKKKLSH